MKRYLLIIPLLVVMCGCNAGSRDKVSFSDNKSESRIDGVRLDFADGWVSVRKSNTEPYLRLLVECRTKDMLEKWVKILSEAIEAK